MANNGGGLGPSWGKFGSELTHFEGRLLQWGPDSKKKLKKAGRKIGHRVKAGAVKRVPVDEGRLRNAIIMNTYEQGNEITTEVGTNVKEYPIYLEFGTKYIAGGAVLAIGARTHVTDADAVHTWAAKEGDAIERTSHSRNAGTGRLHNAPKYGAVELAARPQEQMPWLRPSFAEVRPWAENELIQCLKPPEQ